VFSDTGFSRSWHQLLLVTNFPVLKLQYGSVNIINMSCSLTLEFRGGAELLFGGVKDHRVTLPESDTPWTVQQLLVWIRDNMLQQRADMFMQGCTVRPGILVLINNTDWELCGELSYCLSDNDSVLFISTLHGGWEPNCWLYVSCNLVVCTRQSGSLAANCHYKASTGVLLYAKF